MEGVWVPIREVRHHLFEPVHVKRQVDSGDNLPGSVHALALPMNTLITLYNLSSPVNGVEPGLGGVSLGIDELGIWVSLVQLLVSIWRKTDPVSDHTRSKWVGLISWYIS